MIRLKMTAAALLLGSYGAPALVAAEPGRMLSFPVHHTLNKELPPAPAERDIIKRQTDLDTDTTVFNYSSISYLIELDLGTPSQTVKVVLDTGSSELWVNPDCSKAASVPQMAECLDSGEYVVKDSSSVDVSNETSVMLYGLGNATVQYVRDHISLPESDVVLKDVMFGVATDSAYVSHGILGLSFGNDINMVYNSFVDELVDQDVIDTRTVSIALGAKAESENSGLITFGGVDTKKFVGNLHSSPVLGLQNGEGIYRYWVDLDGVGITDSKGKSKTYSDETFPVFFDTGATLSYLPRKIVEAISADLGGRYNIYLDLVVVPCDLVGTLHFTFGDFTVDVPLVEFIWELSDGATCAMGAEPEDRGLYILGSSFLRSVYAVFDMDTPAIHFAPYANCGTNPQAIPTGKNAAAKFKGECDKDDIPDPSAPSSTSESGSGRGKNSGDRGGDDGGNGNVKEDEDDDENAAGRYSVGAGAMWLPVVLVAAYHAVESFL